MNNLAPAAVSSFLYLLCVRSGRRLTAIAGTNSGGCLSSADTVFAVHGLSGQAQWNTVESQKNYAGRSASFREIEMTPEEISLAWFRKTLVSPCYDSFADFLASFPDAERFRVELTKIKL